MMGKRNELPARNVVQADKIVEALTQEEGDATYVLRDAQIGGKLDLKHRVVHTAVNIQRCTFLDPVDFRYCEFKQTVDLSGCTFQRRFNGGFRTIYKKDLTCHGVTFNAGMRLISSRVEGGTDFDGARFLSKEKGSSFAWTSFGSYLDFSGATFQCRADFNAISCEGSCFFQNTQFESEAQQVNLAWASFGANLNCSKAIFKGPVDLYGISCEKACSFHNAQFENESQEVEFGRAVIGVDLICSNATFKGPVSFSGIRCEGSGFFKTTQFESETHQVRFGGATIRRNLLCHNATFKGPVSFNHIRCEGSGIFEKAQFENESQEVNFEVGSFGVDLDCTGARFAGTANFHSVKCAMSGFFTDARFENETDAVSFTQAFFGQNMDCRRAQFKGPARFDLLTCGGDGLFTNAQFALKKSAHGSDVFDYGDVAFNLSSFASTLSLDSAAFGGTLSLEQVSVQKALRLTRTYFGKNASLYNAKIGKFIVEGGSPSFAEGAYLDLRECTFERFQGDRDQAKDQARDFVNAQDPSRFSRDPYQQLEKYYTSIGDEAEANKIYLEGRHALRQNANQQNTSTKWTLRQKINDEVLRFLTGYGVKIGRLFITSLIVLALGTLIFYLPDNALQPSSNSAEAPAWQDGFLYRTAYSIDLFLPLVNLHIDENWEPNGPWLQAYAIAHATVGWLIVPLLLAALAGIIRR